MRKRKNLKLFRVAQGLTQREMAARLSCSLSMYTLIERGERDGTLTFWRNVQDTFIIPSSDMWSLMQKGE